MRRTWPSLLSAPFSTVSLSPLRLPQPLSPFLDLNSNLAGLPDESIVTKALHIELNVHGINGGSEPNSFQKAASLQCFSLLMFILCSVFTFFLVYALCFFSSPQDLDKYSFYFFLISDEDSLHLSAAFHLFCIFIYRVAHPSCFLPPSVSCSLFVFPFSFCHHKLPFSASHSLLSYMSLVGLNLLCVCFCSPSSSIPPSRCHHWMSNMVSSRVCLVSRCSSSCCLRQLSSP